jgi:hypothetical protein
LWQPIASAKIRRGFDREEGLTEEGAADSSPQMGLRGFLLLWLLFGGIAFSVYAPALRGPLHGDDLIILLQPFMQGLTLPNVVAIIDPSGEPASTTANYAPVHLIAHLLEGFSFGGYSNPLPLHVVNVILHALNAALLALLVSRFSVPLAAGIAVGLLFLLHPANVEAVARVWRRRPGLATFGFALALLSKPVAACLLPAAVLLEWVGVPGQAGRVRRVAWLGVWTLIFLLYALPELGAFQHAGQFRAVDEPGAMPRMQQAVAIVARYVVLGATGWGASISHEPDLPSSLLDRWWLAGLVAIGVLGWVCVAALRRRHPAAPWLGMAAAAYLPVAQILPFRYPMADRYLYFVLAGLLVALVIAATPLLERSLRAFREGGVRATPAWFPVVAVVCAALCVGFAFGANRRAVVWGAATSIAVDAAQHYPNGTQAAILRALYSMNRGDLNGAVAALETARARGYLELTTLASDPLYAPLRGHPRFAALLSDMADWWIRHLEALDTPTQLELLNLAQVYLMIGDLEGAERSYERALAREGSTDPRLVRAYLEEVRRLRSASQP